ncbi:MAG: FecR domain-containing protein [Desulfohalobiaceae bacterium]
MGTDNLSRRRLCALLYVLALAAASVLPASPVLGSDDWFGKTVSVQGRVEVRPSSSQEWRALQLEDILSVGDRVRVLENSRAAFQLRDNTVVRLGQNTSMVLVRGGGTRRSVLSVLRGVVHFFTKTPRQLEVETPFVNAAVEGTEFLVLVDDSGAGLRILEGRVTARNSRGELLLATDQAATATKDSAPTPEDAEPLRQQLAWAMYYPAVYDLAVVCGDAGSASKRTLKRACLLYRQGRITDAIDLLETEVPARDPDLLAALAALFLEVGRSTEAEQALQKALEHHPNLGVLLSQLAILELVRGNSEAAMQLSEQAVSSDPGAAACWLARSYAQQAGRDVDGTLASARHAVNAEPDNALALARLAELLLASGQKKEAFKEASRAVRIDPKQPRAQLVLGFAALADFKARQAGKLFKKAVVLDPADPLARLGLGLARIKQGELARGRQELEIAVSLDPGNAVLRSYLGKAYFEEQRGQPSLDQLEQAKKLDLSDPTPWLYEAQVRQSMNQPVRALQSLQRSIALNDNRAVYRSSLLLDKDLASRSAGLAWLYKELGFDQMALTQGWRSVMENPVDFSGHRVLADSYGDLLRHGIARVSELLQSQLLQPINPNPVLPHLAEPDLFILEGSGPTDPSFNEYNAMFLRDGASMLLSGVAGNKDTLGDEVVLSGLSGGFSYSLGQFHYQTEGFRDNNDLTLDIANAYLQWAFSSDTSFQTEIRYMSADQGDLPLRFDMDNYSETLRKDLINRSVRLGVHHGFSPRSDLIGTVILQDREDEDPFSMPGLSVTSSLDSQGLLAEAQHLFQGVGLDTILGAGYLSSDLDRVEELAVEPMPMTSRESDTLEHVNAYGYGSLEGPGESIWTVGLSADFFDGPTVEQDQVNPKLGCVWKPHPKALVHGAVIRTLQRTLVAGQTIEPTQVAGFNQFFDDGLGVDAWLYGLGAHLQLGENVFTGVRGYLRELQVPYTLTTVSPAGAVTREEEADWKEEVIRGYINLVINPRLTADAALQYELFDREDFVGETLFKELTTSRASLGVSYFHPSGFRARVQGTFIDQDGEFGDPVLGPLDSRDDRFFVLDLSLGYLMPDRRGLVSLDIRNALDADFNYQSTTPKNPELAPDVYLLGKVTFWF